MTEVLTLSAVNDRLHADVLSADLQWSILASAAVSYRHDSVCRPFPPVFLRQQDDLSNGVNDRGQDVNGLVENRDYAELMRAVLQMPSFDADKRDILLSTLANQRHLAELLNWVLNSKTFILSTCDDANKFAEIVSLTGQSDVCSPPDHIFAVTYKGDVDQRFRELQGDRSLIYAYHGSRLENFHSILHFGLQGHLSKNAVFGEGTYLSSELSVSLHYSPTGTGWDRSLLGRQLSCVAVCEIIDDPSVKCKVHDNKTVSKKPSGADSRARIAGSIGGDVPEKYYVVQNNEMMRVKYLLVYVSKGAEQRRSVPWLRQHCFALVIILYVFLLILLALYKSTLMQTVLRYFGYSLW